MKTIQPEFVEYIPDSLESDKLYISMKYRVAIHLCCCGCGKQVVTPFTQPGWNLTIKDGSVSLDPSIGNYQIPCKSHYYITDNKVVWC